MAEARILFALDALGGGTGTHLRSMLETWDAAHWPTAILSFAPRRPAHLPVPVHDAKRLPRALAHYPLAQLHAAWQARRFVRRAQPDVLHAYFFWPILYGRALKRLGLVRHLVENREDQGFGWGRHEYALLRRTRDAPDRVICVSDAVRRVVLEREGLPPSRVVVIRNGISLERAATGSGDAAGARRALGLDAHHRVVGLVANWNRAVKGVRYLLECVPAVVAQLPDARFVLIGRGGEEAALRERVRALGVAPFVVFAGWHADVEPFYRAMDVSALTSLSEGLSMTLLESMRSALPVVATEVGGNPELVVDGETGFLVPPRDTAALAERLVRLLRDPALRARMGAAGRLRVEKHFDIADVAAAYRELYRGLVEAATAPA